MTIVPFIVSVKSIYVFVVVLKLKGPVLIIPCNVYGVTAPVTVGGLLIVASEAPS